MADPGREVASVVVGGACGGLLVEALARRGVMPVTAATAVAIGGGLGALALRGTARRVAAGAAAASVGRLALALLKLWLAAAATPGRATSAVVEPHEQVARTQPDIVIEIPARRSPLEDEDAGARDAGVEADEMGAEAVEGGPDGAGDANADGNEGRDRSGARDRTAAESVC